jgi:hypothetical protein
MRCILQYTPKICPETQQPYGWVAYRPDKPEWLYRFDGTTYSWVRFPKIAISDTPTAVTKAMSGETLGAIIEQHYGHSDPIWFSEARMRLSARNWLRLIDSAAGQGRVAWPPFDSTVESN